MRAGARVLHHQCIDALLRGRQRLGRGGDGGEHRGAGPLQGAHDVRAREAEGETDQFHRVRQQGVDLALPGVVVIEPQRRELHAVPGGIRPRVRARYSSSSRQHDAGDGGSWAGSGTKTFMPNRAPAARVVRISACMASTLLYPAARKPRPPAACDGLRRRPEWTFRRPWVRQ